MGDSSVSCVMSGMSMTYEHAVLIALAPASFSPPLRKRPGFPHGARVIGEGAVELFAPVLLPIFGKMDSYGSLRNIEEDEHTAFLEAKFGMRVEEIASEISNGQRPEAMRKAARVVARDNKRNSSYLKQTVWDGQLYGCFVSREVWDRFSGGYVDEWGKPDATVWESAWMGPEVLRGMGFKFVREDKPLAIERLGPDHHDGPRHTHLFVHPEMPGVEAWCDDHMSTEYIVHGTRLPNHTYRLNEAHRRMRELSPTTGFTKAAIEWAKKTSDVTLTLMKARTAMRRQRKSDHKSNELRKQYPWMTFNARAVDGEDVTYCDGRFHVATAPNTAPVVERCTTPKECADDHFTEEGFKRNHQHRLPDEALPVLAAAGWKVKSERRVFRTTDHPILRGFAPEMLVLYGPKLFGKFLEHAAELVEFSRTMYAVNKLYQPTNTGYQYGHLYLQRQLATFTHDVLDRRIKEREKNE